MLTVVELFITLSPGYMLGTSDAHIAHHWILNESYCSLTKPIFSSFPVLEDRTQKYYYFQ